MSETLANYALVTGASSGIGWHLSAELARRGYNILAISNQQSELQLLGKELELAFNITVKTLYLDLSRQDAAISIFTYCRENSISVEVLINNAGIFFFGELSGRDPDAIKMMLNLHIVTPALLCRYFGEQMAIDGKGYIMNVSSISAVMPYPGISVYGPTKTFLRSFTRALRSELKPGRVNVTCLIPGATYTSLYNTENLNIGRLRKFGLMKSPENVARNGIRALFRNRAECVPGFMNRIILAFMPIIPRSVIDLVAARTRILKK